MESLPYLRLKDHAQEDRPREKMLQHGREMLSNTELLALVIGSGSKQLNAIDLAQQILKKHDHTLSALSQTSLAALQRFRGIGPAKAVRILGVVELARRLKESKPPNKGRVKDTQTAYELLKRHFCDKVVEECWLLLLNNDHRILKSVQVSKGGFSSAHADPAVIMREVLLHNSPRFIVAHNHPSGNPRPSEADIRFTRSLEKAADYMNVRLLDHLIITADTFFSFGARGLLG